MVYDLLIRLLFMQAMLIFRKGAANGTPLIVAPHGGPHVVVTDQFKLEAYFFCQLGNSTLISEHS